MQQRVLAVLMVSAGKPVPLTELVDRLWGETPPEQARNSLYSYIARLRGILRRHLSRNGDADLLRRTSGGYVLDIPANIVDYQRFRRFVEDARDPDVSDGNRRSLLRQALDQWRGTPLTGLGGEWADRVRHQFEQLRINAAAEWSDLELAAGNHRVIIDRLHDLSQEYPVSEALTGQLMRALHKAGRTAEALDTYAAVRQRIVSELGAEPSPLLRDIHQEVLRATSAAPPPARREAPRWRGLQPHLTPLIGRDAEHDMLADLVARERLVTVTGVGGCGKTALTLGVAHDVTRRLGTPGIALALTAVTSAEQVVHALRALLGHADDGRDPLAAVERLLATQPTLLVLDNCEHLAAEVAELVTRLAAGCPELTVLATSRQPLSVAGEAIFTLEPLPVPRRGSPVDLGNPAVRLFVERVRQSVPTVVSDANLEYVAEICRRLDGLPLALELVAARARTFTLRELVDRLGHNLTLLFRTTESGDSRHRTLDATLDWSFQMLADHQRRLFARMAVFVGGFTFGDVEAVCGFGPLAPDEVAATLAALVDRSLVQPYDDDGVRRYRQLEVIKSFAASKLADFEETDVAMRRHVAHWLRRAQRIDRLPRYHLRVADLRRLEPDVANLRQCLAFGFDSDLAADSAEIVARTFEFWLLHSGYLAEGRHWLDRALAAPDVGARAEVHALLRFHQALFVKFVEDDLHGLRMMGQVVGDLARHRPREYLEANAARLNAKQTMLDPSVLSEVEPTVAIALRSDEDDDVLTVINAAGGALVIWGHHARALELSHEFDRRGVEIGASSRAAQLTVQIEATIGAGELRAARLLIDELVVLLDDVAHAAEHDSPRRVIALSYLVNGQAEEARRFLHDAWRTLRTAYPSLTPRLVYLQVLLAEAQRRCGQPVNALRTLSEGLAAAAGRLQFRMSFTGILEAALIAADLGETAASRRLAARWDTLRRGHGLPLPIGFAESATETLELSPARLTGQPERWNPDALRATVTNAATWCANQLRATTPSQRTTC